MSDKPEDVCPRPDFLPPLSTEPLAPAIYPAAVYRCQDPAQAERLLSGEESGYVYSRDAHPNADLLANKCRELHGAERAAVCSSGMAALAAAVLATAEQGGHLLVSDQLYGRSSVLLTSELARFGVTATAVDACDLTAVKSALTSRTKLLVVETITNPLLRVCDLEALAQTAHAHGARLLVDNSLAGPTICRPFEFGADLVVESLTKIMNGHSDVLLGLLCGCDPTWERVPHVLTTWGFSCSPFDCWLALRGLGTLALRARQASVNALEAAKFLAAQKGITEVHYPGLPQHPDHDLARRQFGEGFGSMVTFTLAGGLAAAKAFIAAAKNIPFCPSLGDLHTTLSHPESTSHRTISAQQRAALGIHGGTIRLSVGIESTPAVLSALQEAVGSGQWAGGRKQ